MNPVAVLGVGQTDHASNRSDVSLAGLIREAISRALDDARIELGDVDAVVVGTAPDFFEGVMLPEWWLASALGGASKPVLRIHTMGSVGGATAVSAAMHVASGLYDRVLAVGFEKHSESQALWGLTPANPFGRTFGAGAGAAFAPLCRAYQERYGAPDDIGPRVAVKARQNAMRNPHAHLRKEMSLEDVLASPMLWDPIRRLESCPSSDGACAMIFASAAVADGRHDVAWVRGASTVAEALFSPGRDMLRPPSLTVCAQRVYAQAGITPDELDVAEIYEPFSWIECLLYEAIGLCDFGDGWRMFDRGDTDALKGGRLPVNPSGGVLSTNPIGASGMLRMAEAALQVRGRAGERQVGGAQLALGHAVGGTLSSHACMVLSKERP